MLNKASDTFLSLCHRLLSSPPRWADAWILIGFVVFVTANPYYLNNRINMYELSLYLPGIRAVNEGMIPFKDFFYLRGPLELYMPTWLMQFFGEHIGVLCGYFFVGNVLCLVMVVLIARELIRSRYMFYLMIPVIAARTFPRVCYMNWGGMRYVFGLAAVFCMIRFFKSRRILWIVVAGLFTAAGAMTSVEIGVCAVLAAMASLAVAVLSRSMSISEVLKAICWYALSLLAGLLPWLVYSIGQGAFIPYIDAIWTMASRFLTVINPHYTSAYPSNLPEAFAAMINPGHENFKHMTPAYAYLFLAGYLGFKWYRNTLRLADAGVIALAVYGFVLYQMAFRALLASQFEMALMPQKIVYFLMIEGVILWVWLKKITRTWQKTVVTLLVTALFFFSLSYAFSRFNKRFWSLKFTIHALSGKDQEALKYAGPKDEYEPLMIERVSGIWVPKDQASELKMLDAFIKTKSRRDDVVVMFPEYGAYNFIFDRPFLGAFAMSDLAWLNDRWFEGYLAQFKEGRARYVIVQKQMPPGWEATYFGYPPNKEKYDRIMAVIREDYRQVLDTVGSIVYERR